MSSPLNEKSNSRPKTRGGNKYPFPERLFDLLEEIDTLKPQLANIISWHPNGRYFTMHDRDAFEKCIQNKYFNQTKFASFRRQLNLWGFEKVYEDEDDEEYYEEGKSKNYGGSYFHPLFQRHDRSLCCTMTRNKRKNKENDEDDAFFLHLQAISTQECHTSFRPDSAAASKVSQKNALADKDEILDAISSTASEALSASNEIKNSLMSFASAQNSMNAAVSNYTDLSSLSILGPNEDNHTIFSGERHKKGVTGSKSDCISRGSSVITSSLPTATKSSFPTSSSVASSDDHDASSMNSSSSEFEKTLRSFLSKNTIGNNSSFLAQHDKKNAQIFYQDELPPSSTMTTIPIVQKGLLQQQTVIEEEMGEQWCNELEPLQGRQTKDEYYLSTIQDMNALFLKELKNGRSQMNDLGQDLNDILEVLMTDDVQFG